MQPRCELHKFDNQNMPGRAFDWELCTTGAVGGMSSASYRTPRDMGMKLTRHDTAHSKCSKMSMSMQLARSMAHTIPPEILLRIFSLLSPWDFDNARRTCSRWMRTGLNKMLLESMLKRGGWWNAWQRDCQTRRIATTRDMESTVWKMSRRFATECLLSSRKLQAERRGFLVTATVDFYRLSRCQPARKHRKSLSCPVAPDPFRKLEAVSKPQFSASRCGNYLLVTSGCTIFVYRLLGRRYFDGMQNMASNDILPVTSISCCAEVLAAAIDTSSSILVVAALLHSRIGMICDINTDISNTVKRSESRTKMTLDEPSFRRYFHNICTAEDPPRSISICPDSRRLAFGCASGIELHWICEETDQNCWKYFPTTRPSGVLHFLSKRPDESMEMRLISSPAGTGVSDCHCWQERDDNRHPCLIHNFPGAQQPYLQFARKGDNRLNVARVTHCDYYRAVPIEDGMHLLFIEPRTGLLCIGSDAPVGGQTNLAHVLPCIPPFTEDFGDSLDSAKAMRTPTVFASGSDLSWGLRVVAAYGNRIVLYSVPLDVYSVMCGEYTRQCAGTMGNNDLTRNCFPEVERSNTRLESLLSPKCGDSERLLGASYRATEIIWPFEVYGKEIGTVDGGVVELVVQCSHGGARIWAFGGSGITKVLDVDTFTSTERQASDIAYRTLSVETDGSVTSPKEIIDRDNLVPETILPSRKRKGLLEPRTEFGGQHLGVPGLPGNCMRGPESSTVAGEKQGRAYMAAYIMSLR